MSGVQKILFVEDSEDLLKVWLTLFSMNADFLVKGVGRGASALEMVEGGFCPDVLVTDYYLGDCNGVELISKLKPIAPKMKIIVITGNHEDEGLKKMASQGAISLLIKPVRFKQLKDLIKSFNSAGFSDTLSPISAAEQKLPNA